MNHSIQPILYIDVRALPPAGNCPVCGGECYRPSMVCLRCQRR